LATLYETFNDFGSLGFLQGGNSTRKIPDIRAPAEVGRKLRYRLAGRCGLAGAETAPDSRRLRSEIITEIS
jgi:hypothetical protein